MNKFSFIRSKRNPKVVTRIFQQIGSGVLTVLMAISIILAGCESNVTETNNSGEISPETAKSKKSSPLQLNNSTYEFTAPVFDISATPDGGILVAETIFPGTGSETSIKKITKRGVRTVTDVQTVFGSPINGLAALGSQNFFAAAGGLDLAVGAKILQVTPGGQRMVGDIEAYEVVNDPDANTSPQWKNTLCEEDPEQGFSAGPQTNPYHLTVLKDGNESGVLVADAAGNSLLKVDSDGNITLVAVFTPPVDEQEEYLFLKTALIDETVDCYVQPVPTSVAIGPDGDYFVGELTGSVPQSMGLPIGLSRVWKIKSGSEGVACPSRDCTLVKDGFTSIVDLEFGPDGWLYVVQNSLSSWVSTFIPTVPNTGNILRCDPNSGNCDTDPVATGNLLSAITFDKWGNLWLLENNLGGVLPFLTGKPTVQKIEMD